MTVSGRNNAAVRGSWGANVLEDDDGINTERSFISGSIMNVRKAAEDFRSEHSANDLDDIDQADLCSRLSQPFRPHYDWANIGNYADEKASRAYGILSPGAKSYLILLIMVDNSMTPFSRLVKT